MPPSLKARFLWVKNYSAKRTRNTIIERLGNKVKDLKQPKKWNKHEAKTDVKNTVNFKYDNAKCRENFKIIQAPHPAGLKNVAYNPLNAIESNEGIGMHMWNTDFWRNQMMKKY